MRLLDGLGYGSQDNGYRTPTYPLFLAAIVPPLPHAELSECREARVPACLGEAQYFERWSRRPACKSSSSRSSSAS